MLMQAPITPINSKSKYIRNNLLHSAQTSQNNKMVAKTFLVIALLAFALSVCHAATNQEGLYNCGGAKQIGQPSSNNCCQLCWCLGQENKAFSSGAIQNFCKQQCMNCVNAANDMKQCPNDSSPLPNACSQGLQFNSMIKNAMNKCAAMYMKDPSALRKVPGC